MAFVSMMKPRGISRSLPSGTALWTPASLGANLKGWWKADDLTTLWQDSARTTPVTANSDPVGAWDDLSGNGKHFLQPTAGKRPLYKTSIQNSRACLLGDGVDDVMAVGSVVSNATTFSVCAAMKVVVREPDPTMVCNGTTGATGWALDTHSNVRSFTSQGVAFSAASTDTTNFEIWTGTRNLTGPAWVLRVNGVNDPLTPSNNAMNAPSTNTTIFGTPSETRIVNAYMGELVIVGALLTAGEIASLEAYMNSRWAAY